MKLPWDEKYLRISFHCIFTLVMVYILTILVDSIAYTFTNLNQILTMVGSWISSLFSVLSPLLIALIITYLLDPVVVFFQKHCEEIYYMKIRSFLKRYKFFRQRLKPVSIKNRNKVPKRRVAGVICTLLSVILIITVFGMTLFSQIGGRSDSFSNSIQNVVSSINRMAYEFSELYARVQIKLLEWEVLEVISEYLSDFIDELTGFVNSLANRVAASLASAGNGVAQFLLGFVVSVYMMLDKESMAKKFSEVVDAFIPAKPNRILRNIADDVHAVFSGYIRGQLTDAVIMGVLVSMLLSFLKVPFAVLIGIFTGFSNIIPFFGSLIAFVLATATALFSGEPIKALYAALGILALQQIDSIFIVPRVVGSSVELSPILVLLSLSIAGSLFGIPGMILAVPVTAIAKMFLVRYLERKKLEKAVNK